MSRLMPILWLPQFPDSIATLLPIPRPLTHVDLLHGGGGLGQSS